jgi:hypothetical protein
MMNRFRANIAQKEFYMRSPAAVAIICGLLFDIALANTGQTTSLKPTILEAFASQPTARISWSKEAGRIDSAEASAVIIALIVEDEAQPPHRMRGVRIDLANRDATDQVYIEESKIETIKKALEKIERGIDLFRTERSSTPLRYFGAEEFWNPGANVHTLNAAYYIAPDSSGLSLSAYRKQQFRFRGHYPSEVAVALGRAMEELKQQR